MHSKQRGSFSGKPTDESPTVSAHGCQRSVSTPRCTRSTDRRSCACLRRRPGNCRCAGRWLDVQGTISAGDTATLEIETRKDWPEPNVPKDIETALAAAPHKIQDLWKAITPMAHWEWVRWVEATQHPD